jgi:hypothetical protein
VVGPEVDGEPLGDGVPLPVSVGDGDGLGDELDDCDGLGEGLGDVLGLDDPEILGLADPDWQLRDGCGELAPPGPMPAPEVDCTPSE